MLLDDATGRADDIVRDMLTNQRERLIVIIGTVTIDENIIVIKGHRDRIQFDKLHTLCPTFTDIDRVLDSGIRSGIHDECILAEPIVHMVIIGCGLIEHIIRDGITRLKSVHMPVIMKIAKFLSLGDSNHFLDHVIGTGLGVVKHQGVNSAIPKFVDLIDDLPGAFHLLIGPTILTKGILKTSENAGHIRIQEGQKLLLLARRHQSTRRVRIGRETDESRTEDAIHSISILLIHFCILRNINDCHLDITPTFE